MKTKLQVLFLLVASVCVCPAALSSDFISCNNGLKATLDDGMELEVTFYTPSTVRVEKKMNGCGKQHGSYSVISHPGDIRVSHKETSRKVVMESERLKVDVDKNTGLVSFFTRKGSLLTSEKNKPEFRTVSYSGRQDTAVEQTFSITPGEAVYGLGNLEHGMLSQRGLTRALFPNNIEDGIPLMQTSRGYGIFWDNYSPTTFSDRGDTFLFYSEVGPDVDYYFMYGGDSDGVIAEIRELTGDVPMFPLWTYGFWQSRERYKTQEETVGVVRRYRELGVPLDGIIQDWQYWGNNYLWNAMEFMNSDFSRPRQMVDSIHGMNAGIIISIWSSFGPQTKPYAQLAEEGLLFDIATWPASGIADNWPPRMDYPSGVKVYNAYSERARDIYWKNLTRLADLGMDGWWMDSTEPDHYDDNMDFSTGVGTFRSVRGAYPLLTVGGVHDRQLAADSTRRVFILTRSGWVGQQRYGCNVWTGDVASSWDMLRKQIPAQLNFSMTGNPNVNSDLGGFFCASYSTPYMKAYDNPLFRELTVRWTQMGVFTPMMRSHGADCPREIYNFGKRGEPVFDALEEAVRLRYALLPYIYSTAWDVSAGRSSFMRPLVMDFPADRRGHDCRDEYMFGRQLLVAPVVEAQYTPETVIDIDENTGWDKPSAGHGTSAADGVDFLQQRTTDVYLPAGTDWYDFFTGKRFKGGVKVSVPVTIKSIPVFARAGAIIPIGPDVQYASEKPWDNLTIQVYPGADGTFTLYEDEGDNYNYKKGVYSVIDMEYDAIRNTLTISDRRGSYPGMLSERKFRVVNMHTGKTLDIGYSGTKVDVALR
ncbi:MAG: DUF5110 domain-containing protein [Duncaniella sp.]|nr:DUF5110 domain-containing protein [Duncaniella sp.]